MKSHIRKGIAIAIAIACVFAFEAYAGRFQQRATGGAAAAADEIEVLQLRPNFYMIAGAGGNIGVQIGEDGVVVVDAGNASQSSAVIAAIKKLTTRPIRYLINTGVDPDHVGGNGADCQARSNAVHRWRWRRCGRGFPGRRRFDPRSRKSIAAHERADGQDLAVSN